MATWVPSQGRPNDPIIAEVGTADQAVPACLSSRRVTSTALDHADGVAPQRYRFRLHHGGFTKAEHRSVPSSSHDERFHVRSALMDQGDGIPRWRTDSSSTPTSAHGARFDARSVLMDQADGIPRWRSGFDTRTDTSSTPTSTHDALFDARSVLMDHGDGIPRWRSGFDARTDTSSTPTSAHGARFDARSVLMDHADGISPWRSGFFQLHQPGRFSNVEHPIESSSIPTSRYASGFDTNSVLMDQAHGISPWRSAFVDPHEPVRFSNAEHPIESSSTPTSTHASGFDTNSVLMDMDHAERVESQGSGCLQHQGGLGVIKAVHPTVNSASQTSSHGTRPFHLVSRVWTFKAGFLLMLLLLVSFTGTASGRPTPPMCPVHSDYHACHTVETRVFTKAMTESAPPPTPSILGTANLGCRYTADIFAILACLTPWFSAGERDTFKSGNTWQYLAYSIMLYGLSLPGLAERCNIFITNAICGCLFAILLVLLMCRHRRLYQAKRGQVAAVGAGCIFALAFTIPLDLAFGQLFSEDSAIQGNLLAILAMAVMIIMHALRLLVLNFSWWFLFFNLAGTVSGFLWFCNKDGNTIYASVIVGGAVLRTIEIGTSFVWCYKGESPLIRRTQVVQYGIHLSDRTQYMMERIRQL